MFHAMYDTGARAREEFYSSRFYVMRSLIFKWKKGKEPNQFKLLRVAVKKKAQDSEQINIS